MISQEELAEALKRTRVWIVPEGEPGIARLGCILHPETAANDIALAVQLVRSER